MHDISEKIKGKISGAAANTYLATGLLIAGSLLIPDVRRTVLPGNFRTFLLSSVARTWAMFESPKDKMLKAPVIWQDDTKPIGADNFITESWLTDAKHAPYSVVINGQPAYVNGVTFNYYPKAPKDVQLSAPLEFNLADQRVIKPVIEGYQFYYLTSKDGNHTFFRYDEGPTGDYMLTQIISDYPTIRVLEGYLKAQGSNPSLHK